MSRRAQTPEEPPAAAAVEEVPADVIKRLGPVVLKTFSEQDFHRVDMRTIARNAGMSFATIYRYFRDKEALLFWFIAYWLRELYPSTFDVLDTKGTALERIRNYLLAHLKFYEERPEVGRVIFMTVPLTRWMRDDTYKSRESVRRLLAAIAEGQANGEIRDDLPTLLVFDAWYGVFNRAFLMWEYRGRSYSLTGQWEDLWTILTQGITGPRARARPRAVSKKPAAPNSAAPSKKPALPRKVSSPTRAAPRKSAAIRKNVQNRAPD